VTLDPAVRAGLSLPAICPPMFLVSGPDLVREACAAGILAALPRQNARTAEQFEAWLGEIRAGLDEVAATGVRVGPLAVNLSAKFDADELPRTLEACERNGVRLVISATGNPAELVKRVHDWGGQVFHDVTSVRFAEKAIAADVDGVICIGAGGGGHSGTTSHLALVPKVRSMFDGTIVAAGAIGTGAAIRAAEILGADLAYLGTRFIATSESMASAAYKRMLVDSHASDLHYLPARGGVPANWLGPSLAEQGVDLEALVAARAKSVPLQLPAELRYWADVWSAGQGIELIDDVPSVAELVRRLRREYVAACAVPDMADVARLVDEVDGA
jgi:nitronate monooxygenase